MKIICKRAFHFVDGELFTDRNGETMRKIKNEIVIKPSPFPQEVPDWIKNDGLFELAVKDSNLRVIP